jgi:RNA polymerase sigma-70 factor (ECF subfamily)
MADGDGVRSLSVAEAAALAKLLDEHRPKLLAMLHRRIDPTLHARIDPEDVLGEAFVVAGRRWHKLGSSGMTPYAWLYRITLDCLIEAWRRESRPGRDPRREVPWPERSSAQLGLNLVGSGTSPSEAMIRAEVQERMQRALQRLKPEDKEVLWMRHNDQLTFREAAMVLGVSEDAATQRYARALRRLKGYWQSVDGDEPGGSDR